MKKKTTAENLEARFDAGEDVLDYFDLQNAQWGGAREGAGRKPMSAKSRRVQISTSVSPETARRLRARAKKAGLSLGATLDLLAISA